MFNFPKDQVCPHTSQNTVPLISWFTSINWNNFEAFFLYGGTICWWHMSLSSLMIHVLKNPKWSFSMWQHKDTKKKADEISHEPLFLWITDHVKAHCGFQDCKHLENMLESGIQRPPLQISRSISVWLWQTQYMCLRSASRTELGKFSSFSSLSYSKHPMSWRTCAHRLFIRKRPFLLQDLNSIP